MSWSGIFKEAATVGKREITVRRDAYNEKDAVAIETWSDETLFKVRGLNHLKVSGFPNMVSLSPQIAQLNSLLELIIVENGLKSIPDEVGSLTRLRVLDVSRNELATFPISLYNLTSLQTLLLNHNHFTVESFPPCEHQPFPALQYADLVGNSLTALPNFVYKSQALLELKASHNEIESLEPEIGSLASLKLIEMHKNCLQDLPAELSQCSKLKSLSFEDNVLKDHRLRKVLEQFGATKPKAVLDYLGSRSKKKGKKKGKGKGSGTRKLEESESDDDKVNEFTSTKIAIKIVRPAKYLEVKAMSGARQVRPYLVCAVVRGLDLEEDCSDTYRRFITLQTKIHDTVCKRRRASTIATHSLDSITPPVYYKSAMAHKISFCPLDWREMTTARKFIDHLNANRPDTAKKDGKPYSVDATASNLSKYLPMVDPNQMVYLVDDSKTVLSLPPLTNSEDSKITEKSRDIFIEVTSATSLADAKNAMDALLIGMATSKLLSSTTNETLSMGVSTETGAAAVGPLGSLQQLIVEPVRVIDEADKLLVFYPSRTDLLLDEKTAASLEVLRPT